MDKYNKKDYYVTCNRKIECSICGDKITANNFKRHTEHCDGIPKHQRISKYAGNRGGWNRGVKLLDLLKSGEITNEDYEHRISSSKLGGSNSPGQPYSHEDRLLRNAKLRESAFRNKLGGHTSKQRIYFKKTNGEVVYLQSSYEIKFAQLLEELCVEWSRPEPLTWVDDLGIMHRYYPDFKIGDIFFDTKNDYLAIADELKINRVKDQNNVKILIIRYNQITEEYIKDALIV